MDKRVFRFFMLTLGLTVAGYSCKEVYTPKPRTYVRIDFPGKEYLLYDAEEPYRFEYPAYARVAPDPSGKDNPHWLNIEFPALNGSIYLSYMKIQNNLDGLIEDSRGFVYKHAIKAEQIPESRIAFDERRVYGILYDIKGNAASAVQFFVTDSTHHFLRGALYFNTQPDIDSLSPVIDFVRDDIVHFINTVEWK